MEHVVVAPIAFDPAAASASELAEHFISHGYYKDWKTRAEQTLAEFDTESDRVRFLDVLRRELSDGIVSHREEECTLPIEERPKCPHEQIYAHVQTWIKGHLGSSQLTVATRAPELSINRVELDVLYRTLQTILNQIVVANTSLRALTAGQQVIYEDVMDEFEQLCEIAPAGKKSFIDLFVGRITRMALEHGIKKEIIDPAINDLHQTLTSQFQNA